MTAHFNVNDHLVWLKHSLLKLPVSQMNDCLSSLILNFHFRPHSFYGPNSYPEPSFANGSMRHKGQSQRTPGGTGSSIERGNTINRIKQSDHLKMQYQITISTRILIWVS